MVGQLFRALGARGVAVSAAMVLMAGAALPAMAADAPKAATHTIGLVIDNWEFALWESADGKTECPDGLLYKQEANYEAEYPTAEAKKKFGETRPPAATPCPSTPPKGTRATA